VTDAAQLAELVRAALVRAGLPEREPSFERPRNRDHGDWATNVALTLAKAAGRPPREVASLIAAELGRPPGIERIEIAGPGFLNFHLEPEAMAGTVRQAVLHGAAWGRSDEHAGKRVNVEFISANPTGPLHVGHARWAATGDALANLLAATGWDVTREYYINDAGNQMELFGASVRAAMRGEPPPEEGYRGSYIRDLASELSAAGVTDPDVDEAAYERMLGHIRETLAGLGVRFDVWFSERELHGSGAIAAVVERLLAAGHAYEHDGAVWLRATDFGDDKDRVLLRADGRPTYFAADCAYLASKIARGFDHCVYLLGAGHHGYVARLKAIAQAEDVEADRVEVVIGQNVNLLRGGQVVTMSKRSGEMVTFDELIEEVGADAARYTFLRFSADATIDFDIAEVVRQDRENPVYYVQYSHARIAGIMRTARERGVQPAAIGDAPLHLLVHATEEELIRRIGEYPEVVSYAASERAPHKIARYAEGLAEAFHRFYTECQVVGDDVDVTAARYWLVEATRQTLVNALGLLGVGAPDRM
jgi:arginyl-tRNA synthetase